MAELTIDDPLFDYKAYRFGRSRQIFRGPRPDLRQRYIAFIGGSQTFGRFSEDPFPVLVGSEIGVTTLNLGADGVGPGFFLTDPDVLHAASGAAVCVVQVMCATAISNRMFTVRPRRNIRLHAVSDLLAGIYPEVEFDRFAFVKPMLKHLRTLDPMRFKLIENEIRNAWIGRTERLIASIETPTVLLWFSQRSPDDDDFATDDSSWSHHPFFVNRAMIDSMRRVAEGYVECTTRSGLPQDLRVGGQTVLYRPSGEPIDENRACPSPEMHGEVTAALVPELRRVLSLRR